MLIKISFIIIAIVFIGFTAGCDGLPGHCHAEIACGLNPPPDTDK